MTKHSQEVNAYLEAAPENYREALNELREMIHAVHPHIEESIQYKMPTFSMEGEMVTGFAARAQYISLYCKPEVVDLHRDELGKLNVGKGCIRFKKMEQLPMETIKTIIRDSS